MFFETNLKKPSCSLAFLSFLNFCGIWWQLNSKVAAVPIDFPLLSNNQSWGSVCTYTYQASRWHNSDGAWFIMVDISCPQQLTFRQSSLGVFSGWKRSQIILHMAGVTLCLHKNPPEKQIHARPGMTQFQFCYQYDDSHLSCQCSHKLSSWVYPFLRVPQPPDLLRLPFRRTKILFHRCGSKLAPLVPSMRVDQAVNLKYLDLHQIHPNLS